MLSNIVLSMNKIKTTLLNVRVLVVHRLKKTLKKVPQTPFASFTGRAPHSLLRADLLQEEP